MELFTPGHLVVLLLVGGILLFGWKQMPDMARSLGRSLRIFKTEIKGMAEDDKARDTQVQQPSIPSPPAAAPVTPAVPVPVDAPVNVSADAPVDAPKQGTTGGSTSTNG